MMNASAKDAGRIAHPVTGRSTALGNPAPIE